MKNKLPLNDWYFVAYCLSTLIMSSTLLGYASLDAWYYDNTSKVEGKNFSIGFGLLSMFGAIVCVWSLISIIEYIAHQTFQRRSLKIYLLVTLIFNVFIWVIGLVMNIIVKGMPYYIIVMVWCVLNLVFGLLSLKEPKREVIRPPPIKTEDPIINHDMHSDRSNMSAENKSFHLP